MWSNYCFVQGFVLVSSDKLNLTVRVEDEFTYFADGRPLLAGAKVTLRSRLRGVSLTQYTNESGMAVFSDIREDYYSLYTSAPKHIGDTRVILATPSDNDVRVFLQRTAVTYSWVVKRVTFEDVYKITLEATFETHVPMPVVTITPRELDLEVLQRGLMPVINFELTNHGLIRAEDINFRLPTSNSHPFMHFEMDGDELGSIDANTTMLVPVRVVIDEAKKQSYIAEHGTISKRSNPIACVALALFAGYTYICDRARYNELAVPINNAIAGACSGVGGRGRVTIRPGHYTDNGRWTGTHDNGPRTRLVAVDIFNSNLPPATKGRMATTFIFTNPTPLEEQPQLAKRLE
ncbi:hypothetical protein LSAT2_029466 [Lamellibrachia satsuma]|nr:hypothetical protein LSAT2_029466 [Lamellibrachia satsuma]